MAKQSLVGRVFGRLSVVSLAHPTTDHRGTFWVCECKCGKRTIVRRDALVTNKTKSCGCFALERLSETRGWLKHGHAKVGKQSREYRCWQGMKHRCNNPKDRFWKSYGGKGITVCERWKDSFINFLEDMGMCPDGMQLDRIDNNRGYEPDNCRWTTGSCNCNNKSNNRRVTYNGKTMTVTEWAKQIGKSPQTLFSRLNAGWTDDEVIDGPKGIYNIVVDDSTWSRYRGDMSDAEWQSLLRGLPGGLSFGEAARRLGMNYQKVRMAIHRFKYPAIDGRRFSSRRIIPVEKIDWTQSNADIARKYAVSRERIRVLRKRLQMPFVEARGRHRKTHNETLRS